MKRCLSLILILCLFAALLAGCAAELPSLPPLPGKETPAPEEAEESEIVQTPAPTPAEPKELALVFALPASGQDGEETAWYFSPAEEFDCAFSYPAYCTQWVEKGAVRFDPGWFFARMFFTSVRKDDEGAPGAMVDMLEPGKWNASPAEGTVGTGWDALRMLHLKYDTWRTWVAWETPERYYLLYGVCFDGMEDIVGEIFTTIADSFHTSADLLASAPESGTLLREDGALYLAFEGAELRSGEDGPCAEVRIKAVNRGRETCELFVSSVTADGAWEVPIDARCALGGEKSLVWTFCVPFVYGEEAVRCTELSFSLFAREAESGEVITELPVVITIQ